MRCFCVPGSRSEVPSARESYFNDHLFLVLEQPRPLLVSKKLEVKILSSSLLNKERCDLSLLLNWESQCPVNKIKISVLSYGSINTLPVWKTRVKWCHGMACSVFSQRH